MAPACPPALPKRPRLRGRSSALSWCVCAAVAWAASTATFSLPRGAVAPCRHERRFRTTSHCLLTNCVADVAGVVQTGAEAFQTFLGKLKFPKILKLVEDDNYASTLKTMPLPTIVFVGDENAGKSSTLERIAMVSVLPRSNKICTRQPIALKLRHAEDIPSATPQIRLRIPGHEEQIGLTEDEARNAIDMHMQQLADNGEGVVFGQGTEIEVEVHSDGVPTIDLIDLPGLIAVRINDGSEPEQIAEMTEACTRHYLEQNNTGAVVCVLDATMDNLRTSKALRLVQEARPDLRQSTIGVLAKADKAFDMDWEDEGHSSPSWKLEDRLRGTAEDWVDIAGGYFALKNRNTMASKGLSLQEQNADEMKWIKKHFEGSDIRFCLGITPLVEKIDWLCHQHLNKTYVPDRLLKLEAEEAECAEQLRHLGIAPSELPISDLLDHVDERLKLALSPDVVDTICDGFMDDLPCGESVGSTRYERVMGQQRLLVQYMQSLERNIPVHNVSESAADVLCKCFDSDVQGDFRLCRFSALRKKFVKMAKNHITGNANAFRKQAIGMLGTNIQMSHGGDLDVQKIRNGVADCAMWTLLLPVTNLQCFESIRKVVNATPAEDCAREREELKEKLAHIQESIAALREIQSV